MTDLGTIVVIPITYISLMTLNLAVTNLKCPSSATFNFRTLQSFSYFVHHGGKGHVKPHDPIAMSVYWTACGVIIESKVAHFMDHGVGCPSPAMSKATTFYSFKFRALYPFSYFIQHGGRKGHARRRTKPYVLVDILRLDRMHSTHAPVRCMQYV